MTTAARLESGSRPSAAVRKVFRALAARGYSIRRSIATAALLACAPAIANNASNLPLSTPIAAQADYTTLQAAMDAAAHAALAVSTDFESGGALYELNGTYHFTGPVTQRATTEIDYRVALPPGAKLVALFHTHPGHSGTAGEFSESDKQLQERMHLPLYVVAVDSHTVIGLGAPSFALDVPPVHYAAVSYNGHTCRVLADRAPYWLVDCGAHLYFVEKSAYPAVTI